VRDHLVGEHRVRGERDEMRPAMIVSRTGYLPRGGKQEAGIIARTEARFRS